MATAIRLTGLGKDYPYGGQRGYTTLREQLARAAAAPLRALGRRGAPEATTGGVLRALDEVDLSIEQGETVGFVGHNGAGKSTLLKVLSRITEPTRGAAEVRGRVGSLLEVGTGFHPELSGRENIYLNGAVLGMTRAEIAGRFDEIVAFADVERFLDTPVKRYSSGMYVRLAFSVAAHLEPEILIVDEVLAVGDAAFQRKSVARMGQVAREGRTVLFVSHNMAVIQALCSRAVVLERGRVTADGPVDEAVAEYLRGLQQLGDGDGDVSGRTDRTGRGYARVSRLRATAAAAGVPRTGDPLRIEVEATEVLRGASCTLHVYNALGAPVVTFDSTLPAASDTHVARSTSFVCTVDALPLVPGSYRVDVVLSGDGYVQDSLPSALRLDVEQGVLAGRPVVRGGLGDVAVPHRWEVPDSGGLGGEGSTA